jgi:hypothetical protein
MSEAERKHEADLMRAMAGQPRHAMASAIVSLREHGFHDLADELDGMRQEWVDAVLSAASKHARGVTDARAASKLRPPAKAPRPRPALRVVVRAREQERAAPTLAPVTQPPVTLPLLLDPQRAGSRARDLPGDAS